MSDNSKPDGREAVGEVRQQGWGVPFAQVPDELIFSNDISHGAVRLWMVLQRYSGSKGKTWVGQNVLAKDMGCSARMVREYLKELVNSGWVTVKRSMFEGFKSGNIYTIVWDRSGENTSSPVRNSVSSSERNSASSLNDRKTLEDKNQTPPRVPPKQKELHSTAESGWIREIATEEFTRRNGYAPPELLKRKGDAWESEIADLLVRDKVPIDAIEDVARKIWDYEYHASRFLNSKAVRSSFTAALTAVRSRPRRAAQQATDKTDALLAAAERAREVESNA